MKSRKRILSNLEMACCLQERKAHLQKETLKLTYAWGTLKNLGLKLRCHMVPSYSAVIPSWTNTVLFATQYTHFLKKKILLSCSMIPRKC